MRVVDGKVAITLWGKCLTEYSYGDSWGFLKYFEKYGLELVSCQDKSAEVLICFDHYPRVLRRLKGFPVRSRMLITFEPAAVHPVQHTHKARAHYGTTVVASPRQILGPSDILILPGVLGPIDESQIAERAIKRIPFSVGVLNENKFSFVPGNLYKYRVEGIRELVRNQVPVFLGGGTWGKGLSFDLWRQVLALGVLVRDRLPFDLREAHFGLPKSKFLTLRGRVPSVLDFYSEFEFALVIENDPNYLSEKLFNALQAGCVPLYVGPPLQEFGLSPELAIQISRNLDTLSKTVRTLTEDQKRAIVESGRRFLQNQECRHAWSDDRYSNEVAQAISEHCKKQTKSS